MTAIEAGKYIIGITVACLGWFIASTLTEIKADIKVLLDAKAIQSEQIRALERATFGKVSEPKDFAYNGKQKLQFYNMVFDKTKVLKYENEHFIYS